MAPACNVVSVASLPITFKFLFPNLKSTVQVHRHSRCEVCFILEEVPAQKYHQLSSSLSSDDLSHFCGALQSSVAVAVYVYVFACVHVRLHLYSASHRGLFRVFVNAHLCVSKRVCTRAVYMYLIQNKLYLYFFPVRSCHHRLMCHFFKSFKTVRKK